MSENRKENCLKKCVKSKSHYRCSTTLLERQDLTSTKFINHGEVSFFRDEAGWYEQATMVSGNHTYTVEDFDGDYKITVDKPNGTDVYEMPLYQVSDIISIFLIMEKMRKKIGKNKQCSDKKITKIKATKTTVEDL